MSNQYAENIFDSVVTITENMLNKIAFDLTFACTVLEQDTEDKTKYRVSSGAMTFEAFSSDSSKKYTKGATVYVTIPGGDYDNRKIIIGSASNKELEKSQYIDAYDLLLLSKTKILEFDNNNNIEFPSISTNSTKKNAIFKINNIASLIPKYKAKYNRLGLKFKLDTTALRYSNTFSGRYGFVIQFYDATPKEILNLQVSDLDLLGNTYALTPEFLQTISFEIPRDIDISLITSANLILIQNSKFDITNKKIIVKELSMSFGYDTTEVEAGLSLFVEGEDNLKYNLNDTPEENQTRSFHLNWIYQKENEWFDYHTENKPLFDYKIYLLRSNKKALYGLDIEKSYEIDYTKDFPNKFDDIFNWEIIALNNEFEFENVLLRTEYSKDIFKVIIRYKEKESDAEYKYLNSNIIEFVSEALRPDDFGVSGNNNFEIEFVDPTTDNGVYNSFGMDGSLMNLKDRGPHKVLIKDLCGKSKFIIPDSVKWELPTENTMLEEYIPPKTSDDDETAAADKEFPFPFSFYIKRKYLPQATNNTIVCTFRLEGLSEDEYIAKYITVGYATANGSNYLFNLLLKDTNAIQPNASEPTEVVVLFADIDGKDLLAYNNTTSKYEPEIEWSWVHGGDGITLDTSNNHAPKVKYTGDTVPESNYYILQGSIKNYEIDNGLKATLTAYLPIPIAAENYVSIAGATRVVYGSSGYEAEWDKSKYELFNKDYNSVSNTTWHLSTVSDDEKPWGIPQLRKQKDYNNDAYYYKLEPPAYLPSVIPQVSICAKQGESVLWSLPILFLQNKWDKELLNNWDGTFYIDDKEGTILSNLLVAGKKESDNTFTGVLMGEISKTGSSDRTTGIYGYREGALAFKFDENGNAFIGLEDGNKLEFKNGLFNLVADGIDLTATKLNVDIGTGTENQFLLDSSNQTFRLGRYKQNDDNGEYELSEGIEFVEYKNGKSLIVKSNNFNIDADGKVTIIGKVTAKEGEIAGWNIVDNDNGRYLYSTNDDTGLSTGILSNKTAAFAAGIPKGLEHSTWLNANFLVNHDGSVYAKRIFIGAWSYNEETGELTKDTTKNYILIDNTGTVAIQGGITDESLTTLIQLLSTNLTAQGGQITALSNTVNSQGLTIASHTSTLSALATAISAKVSSSKAGATNSCGWNITDTNFTVTGNNKTILEINNNGTSTFTGAITATSFTATSGSSYITMSSNNFLFYPDAHATMPGASLGYWKPKEGNGSYYFILGQGTTGNETLYRNGRFFLSKDRASGTLTYYSDDNTYGRLTCTGTLAKLSLANQTSIQVTSSSNNAIQIYTPNFIDKATAILLKIGALECRITQEKLAKLNEWLYS